MERLSKRTRWIIGTSVAVVVGGGAFLTQCDYGESNEEISANPAHVEGRVSWSVEVYGKGGAPVQGAKVTLGGQVALTNEEGVAKFANLAAGASNVTVAAEGYTRRDMPETLTVGVQGVTTVELTEGQGTPTAAAGMRPPTDSLPSSDGEAKADPARQPTHEPLARDASKLPLPPDPDPAGLVPAMVDVTQPGGTPTGTAGARPAANSLPGVGSGEGKADPEKQPTHDMPAGRIAKLPLPPDPSAPAPVPAKAELVEPGGTPTGTAGVRPNTAAVPGATGGEGKANLALDPAHELVRPAAAKLPPVPDPDPAAK
jgi:hypothetical protein